MGPAAAVAGRHPGRVAATSGARPPAWREVAQVQAGVVTRRQVLTAGMAPAELQRRLRRGEFASLMSGVYATFTGPLPPPSRVWAALLYAGPGAAVAGRSALWLHRLVDALPATVEVAIPPSRRVVAQPGVRILVRRRLDREVHPAVDPPRLRLEPAVLDVVDGLTRPQDVVALVLRATQRRHTTPDRLAAALAARPRHAWRRLLGDVLADAADGVQSVLERRYLHDVERAHGLPRGRRNERERSAGDSSRYRDVRHRAYRVIVELDGREAHPPELTYRDRQRDVDQVLRGETVLRFGWAEVAADPCGTAAAVAVALHLGGWRGTPSRCGPTCRLR